MAYAREMFLRDNYPKDYEQFLLVKDDVLKIGIEKGRVEGNAL